MAAEKEPNPYLLPVSESAIRGIVQEVNFNHLMKGRIKSMHAAWFDPPEEYRFVIEIAYEEVPYATEEEYARFERDMESRLRVNLPNLVVFPSEIWFERRERGQEEEEE